MSDLPVMEKSAYEAGFVDGIMVAGDGMVGLYLFELVVKHGE